MMKQYTPKIETNQDRFEWYLKHKRWGFAILPIYHEKEFDKALNELNQQFETYKYIYDHLDEVYKIEFKGKYIGKLKRLQNLQKGFDFKDLIEIQISKVENFPKCINRARKYNYSTKENALSYIFDLYANGKKIPFNPINDKYDKAHLEQIGREKGFKGDTFYRAIRDLNEKYDLNKKKDLKNISKRWLEAVTNLSENQDALKTYLKQKELL